MLTASSSIIRIARLVSPAVAQTAVMVSASLAFSHLMGMPLGVLLVLARPQGLKENRAVYAVLNWFVNIGRSVPFVVLMFAIIPLTRWLTGTSIGTVAAIVPLSVSAVPFVARLTETAMLEVGAGPVEACLAMGATPWQIVKYVLFPESLPALVSGAAITAVNLVGYSAMAGAVGGGGLGDVAIRYGYQRWEPQVMLVCLVVLVVLVQMIQHTGDVFSRRFRH